MTQTNEQLLFNNRNFFRDFVYKRRNLSISKYIYILAYFTVTFALNLNMVNTIFKLFHVRNIDLCTTSNLVYVVVKREL